MRKITQEQFEEFNGQLIADSWYCAPVQDINGDWFISSQEADVLGIAGEEIEYIAPIIEEI